VDVIFSCGCTDCQPCYNQFNPFFYREPRACRVCKPPLFDLIQCFSSSVRSSTKTSLVMGRHLLKKIRTTQPAALRKLAPSVRRGEPFCKRPKDPQIPASQRRVSAAFGVRISTRARKHLYKPSCSSITAFSV
jgi:hypothetical protein